MACTFCGTLCAAHRASFWPARSVAHCAPHTELRFCLHILRHTPSFWHARPAVHGSTWACTSCSTQHFGLQVLRHTAPLGLACPAAHSILACTSCGTQLHLGLPLSDSGWLCITCQCSQRRASAVYTSVAQAALLLAPVVTLGTLPPLRTQGPICTFFTSAHIIHEES